jgi:hypothetical protein
MSASIEFPVSKRELPGLFEESAKPEHLPVCRQLIRRFEVLPISYVDDKERSFDIHLNPWSSQMQRGKARPHEHISNAA